MPTTISGNDGVSQVQNNTITQADLAAAIVPLGVGQTWVNSLGIRSFGQTYTNDTGRPILVYIAVQWASGQGLANIVVGGSSFYGSLVSGQFQVSAAWALVPPGGTYRLEGTGSLGFTTILWNEMR